MTDRQEQFLADMQQHRKIIFKVCNAYCRNGEDRKDLEQEIVLQVWRSYERFDGSCRFSTWLYRVALNVAISFYRKERTRVTRQVPMGEDTDYPAPSSDPFTDTETRVANLHRFIHGLDNLNRALMLLYLDDMTHREIAETLGITETNVATRIHRIKQKLKSQFSQHME